MIHIGDVRTRIYLAIGATDLRKGFEGLYGLVQSQMELEGSSGHLFVFCNQSKTRIKVLYFDGSGLWVCAKRLEKGRFSWPKQQSENRKVELSHGEFYALLEGIDLSKSKMKGWWRKKIRLLLACVVF